MSKNKSKYLREQEPKIEEKNQKKGGNATGEAMYRAILVIAISLVLFILVGMLF